MAETKIFLNTWGAYNNGEIGYGWMTPQEALDFIEENCPAAFLFALERFVCYANTAHCDFFAEFCRNSA